MGASLSHRDTRKSTCTYMSAHKHKHTNASPCTSATASGEVPGLRAREGPAEPRVRPPAPLLGLAQQADRGRALAELAEPRWARRGAAGRSGQGCVPPPGAGRGERGAGPRRL